MIAQCKEGLRSCTDGLRDRTDGLSDCRDGIGDHTDGLRDREYGLGIVLTDCTNLWTLDRTEGLWIVRPDSGSNGENPDCTDSGLHGRIRDHTDGLEILWID